MKYRKKDRIKALKLAALAMSGHSPDDEWVPRVWSLAVFFESYISGGATGTRKEFGPKKPAKLKVVNSR